MSRPRCTCGEFRDDAPRWECPLCGELWLSLGEVVRVLEERQRRRKRERKAGQMDLLRGL